MPRVLIACPHCYPDLARLWYRAVRRELVPALQAAGLEVGALLFRDANPDAFDPADFPAAVLDAPRPGCRDFIEFYDAALAREGDFLFLMDADVFFLDGGWPASYLGAFADDAVAAVTFLHRPELPGAVYALLCRSGAYRALSPPVLAACYDDVANWPNAGHRDPGEQAADRLAALGKRIVEADEAGADAHLADFHGTTNLRVSRQQFGNAIGEAPFEALIARKAYFAMGAYDNLCLGAVYEAVYGEPFAPGPAGEPLGGSLTADALRRVLGAVEDAAVRAKLRAYFGRSDRSASRLAAREGVRITLPDVVPGRWGEAAAP